MILLDNSVLRKYARPDPDPEVVAYLKGRAGDVWVTAATVAYEYLSYYDSQSEIRTQRRELERRLQRIVPMTVDVAAEASRLRLVLGKQGVSLNYADLVHLATAQEVGATFVTCDAADFDRPEVHQLTDVDVVRTD